jgi:hypothetical protein
MPAGITYEPLGTYNLSGLSSVTFSSISSAYTDLVIHYSGVANAGTANSIGVRFNSDSAANYAWGYFESNAGSTSGNNSNGTTYALAGYVDNSRSSGGTININNYRGGFIKQIQSLHIGANSAVNNVTSWSSTAAITSVTFLINSNAFASPSVVSLYGIARA